MLLFQLSIGDVVVIAVHYSDLLCRLLPIVQETHVLLNGLEFQVVLPFRPVDALQSRALDFLGIGT